jgi:predicted RNase H-like nuclease (RuvC/YqgF family)
MKREDTKATRIETLKKTQEARKQDAIERVYKAIERLQKIDAKINFQNIAREANLSVSYLYKYPELKQHIAELRAKQSSFPIAPVAQPNSTSTGKVIARLKDKIQKLEQENKELKRKCEALAGQVYRAHHLQAQVERLQEQNEDLRNRLGEKEIAKKVTSIDQKRKAKSIVLKDVQSELDDLGIRLNPTLTKTIELATEETTLAAIEALKDQLAKKDIPNPGGWLNTAIKEGWTKPESKSTQPTAPQSRVVTSIDKSNKKLMSTDKLKQLSNLFNHQDD